MTSKSKPETSQPARRRFLQMSYGLAGAAAMGELLPACGSTPMDSPAMGLIAAGNISAVAVGSLTPIAGQPLVLGRDAGGLYSMSTLCTHQGCNILTMGSVSASGLACNCHGSTYDANGTVTRGPARAPLDHYKVDLASDGSITIEGGVIVAQNARIGA
jgi:nitrite reductase/ring-hydroxylating ferredoxin subunit